MDVIFIIVGILLVLVHVLPVFHRVFNMGSVFGIGLGAGYLLLGIFWHRLSFTQMRYVAFFGGLLIFTLICAGALLVNYSRRYEKGREVLIVLGCRIRGDVPSLALEKRIDAAFFYLMENPDTVAILSGGQGPDENLSEGLCMYQHLVDRGISKNRLFVEDSSVNTDENIRFSKKLMEKNGFGTSVAICTSEYHQYRAHLICRRYGLDSVPCSSKTLPLLLPTFVTRELLGLVKERLFPTIKIK